MTTAAAARRRRRPRRPAPRPRGSAQRIGCRRGGLGRPAARSELGRLVRGEARRVVRTPHGARDGARDQRVDEHRDHRGADQRGADARRDRPAVRADADDRDDERERRRTEEGDARCAPRSELP